MLTDSDLCLPGAGHGQPCLNCLLLHVAHQRRQAAGDSQGDQCAPGDEVARAHAQPGEGLAAPDGEEQRGPFLGVPGDGAQRLIQPEIGGEGVFVCVNTHTKTLPRIGPMGR